MAAVRIWIFAVPVAWRFDRHGRGGATSTTQSAFREPRRRAFPALDWASPSVRISAPFSFFGELSDSRRRAVATSVDATIEEFRIPVFSCPSIARLRPSAVLAGSLG
jgi:hypothetical protein